MVINIHHNNGQPSIRTRIHMLVSDVSDTLAGNSSMSAQSKNDTGQSVPSQTSYISARSRPAHVVTPTQNYK